MNKLNRNMGCGFLTIAILMLIVYLLILFLSNIEVTKHPSDQAYSIAESKEKKVFICEYEPHLIPGRNIYGITSAWVDVNFKYKLSLFLKRSIIPLSDTTLKISATPQSHLHFKELRSQKTSSGVYYSPFAGYAIYINSVPDSLHIQVTNSKTFSKDTILFTRKS